MLNKGPFRTEILGFILCSLNAGRLNNNYTPLALSGATGVTPLLASGTLSTITAVCLLTLSRCGTRSPWKRVWQGPALSAVCSAAADSHTAGIVLVTG